MTEELRQRLATWLQFRREARQAKRWHPALAVTRRMVLTGGLVVGASQAAEANLSWIRVITTIVAPVVPTVTPQFFAAQASTEHTVQQPAQDFTLYNATGDGHCMEAPAFTIDFQDDVHIREGATGFTFAICGDHADVLKLPSSFRVYLCGDGGYTSLNVSENMQISPRSGAIGSLVTINIPSSTSRRYLFLRVDMVPQNGYVQSVTRRLMIEEIGFSAVAGNVVYVSGGDPAASDSNSGASASLPFANFIKAENTVNFGGIIMLDARYTSLVDVEYAGSGRDNVDAVDVRPYNGAEAVISRAASGASQGYTTSTNATYRFSLTLRLNKVHFYNVAWDSYRIGYTDFSVFTNGIGVAWVNSRFYHDQMSRDGHFHSTAPFNNDGVVYCGSGINYGAKSVAMIGCTGVMPNTSGLTLGVNNSISIPWDINFMPAVQEYSAGFSRHNVTMNRLFISSASSMQVAPLLTTGVTEDSFNELAVVGLDWEVFPGSATVAVDGTGTATITAQSSSGQPMGVCLPSGVHIVFNNGPIAGLNLQVGTYVVGNQFKITGTGVGTVAAGALYTFKFKSYGTTVNPIGQNGESAQFRVISGAAASAYDPSDSGLYEDYPAPYRKSTPDYSNNAYILKSSLGWIGVSSRYGNPLTPMSPMRYTPFATVAGNVLTATGPFGAGPVAGPGTISTTLNGNGRYLTCSTALPKMLSSIGISAGGSASGWAVGDTFLVPGTYTLQGRGIVTSVDGTGKPTAVAISAPGLYSAVSTSTISSGSGAGAGSFQIGLGISYPVEGWTIRAGGRTFRLAGYANTGSTTDANGFPANSVYLRDFDLAWADLSGATWAISGVEGHGLAPNCQVQFGSGTVCTVVSVSGRTATLSVAPGDTTTPTAFSRFMGNVDQALVQVVRYDQYGNPINSLINGIAAGDQVMVPAFGNNQHADGWQNQQTLVSLGCANNVYVGHSRWRGNDLQAFQVSTYAGWGAGQIVTTSGTSVSFILPSLSLSAGTYATRQFLGRSYPSVTLTVTYGGVTGASNFTLGSGKRMARVLFKTGPYAGQSMRMISHVAGATTATMVLVDDNGIMSGSYAGSVGDTIQQPLPVSDGDVVSIGDPGTAATQQGRRFWNDWGNIGSGTIDRPFTGTPFTGVVGGGQATNWVYNFQVRSMGIVATQMQFGLTGYTTLTLSNTPGGGFENNTGVASLFFKQASWYVGINPSMVEKINDKKAGWGSVTFIDTLHGGIASGSVGTGSIPAASVKTVGTMFTNVTNGGHATDYVAPTSILNGTLSVDPDTAVPSVSGGNIIPLVMPSNPYNCFGQRLPANTLLPAGCGQLAA